MKNLFLLISLFFLVGCAESMSLLAPMSGAANGKLVQSSLNTALSYGVKQQTGKTPVEHILESSNQNTGQILKKKTTTKSCVYYLEPTSADFCKLIKAKISKLSKIQNLN